MTRILKIKFWLTQKNIQYKPTWSSPLSNEVIRVRRLKDDKLFHLQETLFTEIINKCLQVAYLSEFHDDQKHITISFYKFPERKTPNYIVCTINELEENVKKAIEALNVSTS